MLVSGGPARAPRAERDYSHLGFALESRAAVDRQSVAKPTLRGSAAAISTYASLDDGTITR